MWERHVPFISVRGSYSAEQLHIKSKWSEVGNVKKVRPLAMMMSSLNSSTFSYEKKEEIWLSPMTKSLHSQKNKKKQRDTNFITQQMRTNLGRPVWSINNHPTVVVKPVYERSTFPLTATAVFIINCPSRFAIWKRTSLTLNNYFFVKILQ